MSGAGRGPVATASGKATCCGAESRSTHCSGPLRERRTASRRLEARHFCDRSIAAGKLSKVALVACTRKLLTALNAMVRTGKPWDNSVFRA